MEKLKDGGLAVQIMEKQLYSAKEVEKLVGMDRLTIRRHVKAGLFPAPIQFGRTVKWRAADIRALGGTKER